MIIIRPLACRFFSRFSERLDKLDEFFISTGMPLSRQDDHVYINNNSEHIDYNSIVRKAEFDISSVFDDIYRIDIEFENIICRISACLGVGFEIFCDAIGSFFVFVEKSEETYFSKIEKPTPVERTNFEIITPLHPGEAFSELADRPQAAKFLASINCAGSASAQHAASIRLFEAAFKKSGKELVVPLFKFLSTGIQKVSEAECSKWIYIRDGIIHADGKWKNSKILFDADAFPFNLDIRQAAMDVALNKKSWGTTSHERRITSSIAGFVVKKAITLFQRNGENVAVRPFVSDFFGRYPSNTSSDNLPNSLTMDPIKLQLAVKKAFPELNLVGMYTHNGYNIIV